MLAPWKKSCDQPRQHIKKQRYYFADKDLSSQSYGFSSGHVLDVRVGLWRKLSTEVMTLLFNMLSRLIITFLPRSKHLLISWLQSPSTVILEPKKKIKSATISTVSSSIFHEVMGPDAMILVFWMFSFKPTFSLSSFTFFKRLFSSSSLSVIRVVSSAYPKLLIFLLAILLSKSSQRDRRKIRRICIIDDNGKKNVLRSQFSNGTQSGDN